MESLICNACGGNSFAVDGQYFICEYCGTRTFRKAQKSSSTDTTRALKNALNAYQSGLYDACMTYCAIALNEEPSQPTALYLRGASSYYVNESKPEDESRAWKLACNMAENNYAQTNIPLDFVTICFPIATRIKLVKKDADLQQVDSEISRLKKELKKAEEREERLRSDVAFRAANGIQSFLGEASGKDQQKPASSEEVQKRIDESKQQRVYVIAKYVDELSDVLADSWNLTSEHQPPIGLLKQMRSSNEALEEALEQLAKHGKRGKPSKIIKSCSPVAEQLRGFINEAIIETGEKEHPGIMAEYRQFLAKTQYDKSQHAAQISAIENELRNTGLFELKRQYDLRTELSRLRKLVVGPYDPCAAFANMVLDRYYKNVL